MDIKEDTSGMVGCLVDKFVWFVEQKLRIHCPMSGYDKRVRSVALVLPWTVDTCPHSKHRQVTVAISFFYCYLACSVPQQMMLRR
jgi:hypothetical protein